jgi:hypothetical protein
MGVDGLGGGNASPFFSTPLDRKPAALSTTPNPSSRRKDYVAFRSDAAGKDWGVEEHLREELRYKQATDGYNKDHKKAYLKLSALKVGSPARKGTLLEAKDPKDAQACSLWHYHCSLSPSIDRIQGLAALAPGVLSLH